VSIAAYVAAGFSARPAGKLLSVGLVGDLDARLCFRGDNMLTRSKEVTELWERLGAVVEELEAIRAVLVVLHVAVSEDEKLIRDGGERITRKE